MEGRAGSPAGPLLARWGRGPFHIQLQLSLTRVLDAAYPTTKAGFAWNVGAGAGPSHRLMSCLAYPPVFPQSLHVALTTSCCSTRLSIIFPRESYSTSARAICPPHVRQGTAQ